MRRRLLVSIRIVVSGGLLAYLILRADPAKVWQDWRAVDGRLLVLALLLQAAGVALSAAKWGSLLSARGRRQPYPWLLGAYLAGQFANSFLPTTIGGDALRAAQLGRRIGSLGHASASIFLERLTGFLALSLIANAALFLTVTGLAGTSLATTPELLLLAAIFTLAGIVAIGLCFGAPRLQAIVGRHLPDLAGQALARIAEALSASMPRGRSLALILGMSLLFQALWIAIHAICGQALHVEAPLLLYALMVPMTDMLSLAPIFVNSLGARELVFTLYLTQVGVSPATAFALAFLVFSVRLAVSALGGLVILLGGADARVAPGPAIK